MKWKKLGCLFRTDGKHPKLQSHTANPLAIPLDGDVFRILYSGRDQYNRSSVGFVDVDICRQTVIYSHTEPIFVHGDSGSFFSHGVSIGNAYRCNGMMFVLFMGWQVEHGKHWRGDIGRLVLQNDNVLTLTPDEPFIGCDAEDPISLSYPWVIFDQGVYKMWYGSTVRWDAGNGEMIHIIKYATSIDAEHWQKCGQAISHAIGVAQAFSRPSVVVDHNGYHMWYSYRNGRGTKYRIGYSHSKDGLSWATTTQPSGIDVSDSGWDSDMICYPFVFDHKGQRYMLYNGNDYGRTGFGLALLEKG
jgi:hypothetical protein